MKNNYLLLFLLCCHVLAFSQDKVAVLYVYPNDVDASKLFTKAQLEAQFNGPVKKFWTELSYGKYNPTISIFTATLPLNSSQTVPANGSFVIDMLKKMLPDGLNIPGYDPDQYKYAMIMLGGNIVGFSGAQNTYSLKVNGKDYPKLNLSSFSFLHPSFENLTTPRELQFAYYPSGLPFKGQDGSGTEVITYSSLGLWKVSSTVLHEWGHALGLQLHANNWRSTVEPLYGDIYWFRKNTSLWDQEGEYGNLFDIMGGGTRYSLHFNAFFKDLLGWFAPSEKIALSGNMQDVRLMPLESQEAGKAKCAVYAIPNGVFTRPPNFDNRLDYAFYLEYRQPMGFDIHLGHEYLRSNTEGLMICMTRKNNIGFWASWLLDMSPDNIVHDRSPTVINSYATDPLTGKFCCQNTDDNHEASLNAGKTFYDDQIGFCLTNIRPQGINGILFDTQVGKKVGVKSGVYTTTLFPDQALTTLDTLYSTNLQYYLSWQNGQWVMRRSADNIEVWRLPTISNKLTLIAGELVLSQNGQTVWRSATTGKPITRLWINNNGELNITDGDGKIVWSSKAVSTIELPEALGKVTVSPNPVFDALQISFSKLTTSPVRAVLTDLNGRTLHSTEIHNQETVLDMNGLPAAVYILSLTDGKRWTKSVKVVKY